METMVEEVGEKARKTGDEEGKGEVRGFPDEVMGG